MGTNYFMNTKDKPEHTNVYYKDTDNKLCQIRVDAAKDMPTDALEARALVADMLDELKALRNEDYKKPVLALIEGGKE